ncbi:amidase family protein [Myxosarcina sp. GI1]|uniref:amidase family protein n=1 Tax=Myxosarcina sp. GI1 TaxID=1541065 RepID=UPI0009079731|nr:amidase family protein [Myxosarcina sp. GI1]
MSITVTSTSEPVSFNLTEATVAEINEAFEFGALTSEKLARLYLNRVEAYDPLLNPIIELNPDLLEQARAIDVQRQQGNISDPLAGIPVLLKDNVDTADLPTTAGSLALEGSIPPDDALITAELQDAGALILGKASLTEFANFLTDGMPNGYSSLNGFTYNPYNPTPEPNGEPIFDPGGSSSGPAVAVAASLAPVSVGTETSGSILSPATNNSVVGIKPTVGLVSRDGIIPISASQDTAGPFGRTVADAATLLGDLTGVDPSDPATAASEGKFYTDYTQFLDPNALDGARIGVPKAYWERLSEDQVPLIETAISTIESQGATIVYEEIPTTEELSEFSSSVLFYEFKRDLNAYLDSLGDDAPVDTLAEVIAFNEANAEEALRYGQTRALESQAIDLVEDREQYLEDRATDLRLAKEEGIDAYLEQYDLDAILFPENFGASIAAKAGYPSINVPGGYIPNGEPFGVTFSGTAFSEPELIGFAYDYEQASKLRVSPESTPPLEGELFEYQTQVTVTGDAKDNEISPELVADFDGNGDLIFAGAGEDLIDTSQALTGSNRIYGGAGKDEVIVGLEDFAAGGKGDDLLDASVGRGQNRLYGGAGNDEFFLGSKDRAFGGNGSDSFFVLAGGNNFLTGGVGADQFWIANAELPDAVNTITDFEIGKDVIGIGGLDLSFDDLSLTQQDGDTLIATKTQDLAILQGITASLGESDFVLV